MNKNPVISVPMSRARRVIGLIFFALGILILSQMTWLFGFHSLSFGSEEWLRFECWILIGSVLALTGLWLRRRSRLAGWAALLGLPVFITVVWLEMQFGLF
jgi:hypothetical protein